MASFPLDGQSDGFVSACFGLFRFGLAAVPSQLLSIELSLLFLCPPRKTLWGPRDVSKSSTVFGKRSILSGFLLILLFLLLMCFLC